MRIISKFKDYYDGCQNGIDKEPVYVRHTRELMISNEQDRAIMIEAGKTLNDKVRFLSCGIGLRQACHKIKA